MMRTVSGLSFFSHFSTFSWAHRIVIEPLFPNSGPFHLFQQSPFRVPLTCLKAASASGLMFFPPPWSYDQKAIVTVIESPKWAKVPFSPVNFAWTFFIGASHDG